MEKGKWNNQIMEKINSDKFAHKSHVLKSKSRSILGSVIHGVFIIGFCFVLLYPLLNMISRSFMHPVDLFDNSVLWVPKHFSLDNFRVAAAIMNYREAFFNSFMIAFLTTVLQTFTCLFVGYGFARFQFPFKKILLSLVILTIVIPPQLIMVSIFLHFRFFDVFGIISVITGKSGLNLIDTLTPSVMLSMTGMGIKNGLFIYIFTQFFRGMPKETEESSYVDGANPIKTFFFIMAPGATTAIVTVVLFSFVWQWNDIFYSGMFYRQTQVLPATYGYLVNMLPEMIVKTNPAMARFNLYNPLIRANLISTGVLLMISPLVILYLFAQKYFVESIERTGVVG